MLPTFCVLGAGSFGAALAQALSHSGPTKLWGRETDLINDVAVSRQHPGLPRDVRLNDVIELTADFEQAVNGAHVLIAVPSHAFESVLTRLKPLLANDAGLAWATKGLTQSEKPFLHQAVQHHLGEKQTYAIVSGPNFAGEIAQGLPAATTVAGNNESFTCLLAERLSTRGLRAYTSDDVFGVELGGAYKNVLAIATGMCAGLALGENAQAALMTRGMHEFLKLAEALGAQTNTCLGMSGLGDIILCSNSDTSRNRQFGKLLGQGSNVEQAKTTLGKLAEGYYASPLVLRLAQTKHIECPIAEAVHNVLYKHLDPKTAALDLLARPLSKEN